MTNIKFANASFSQTSISDLTQCFMDPLNFVNVVIIDYLALSFLNGSIEKNAPRFALA